MGDVRKISIDQDRLLRVEISLMAAQDLLVRAVGEFGQLAGSRGNYYGQGGQQSPVLAHQTYQLPVAAAAEPSGEAIVRGEQGVENGAALPVRVGASTKERDEDKDDEGGIAEEEEEDEGANELSAPPAQSDAGSASLSSVDHVFRASCAFYKRCMILSEAEWTAVYRVYVAMMPKYARRSRRAYASNLIRKCRKRSIVAPRLRAAEERIKKWERATRI